MWKAGFNFFSGFGEGNPGLNTVKKADKVVVLSNGEIIEAGYQQDLLQQNGIYSQMVHSSDGDFDELLDW